MLTIMGVIVGGIVLFGVIAWAILIHKIDSYVDPWQQKVVDAGFVLKSAKVNQIELSYAEGPDNGPPLILLHAQFLDWFSYSRVLPALSRSFHVFDVDYPGHGATKTPADYPMTANQIGSDLATFIEQQIGDPVFVTGNSSGGLLATWLAANRPDLVKAALLEDPPLFSSEYPEIKKTIAYRAFRTSYTAIQDHPSDFLLYWIHENAPFFRKNIGPGTPFLLSRVVHAWKRAHPDLPPDIGLIKDDTVRMMLRGMDEYDPRFGAAFYDGSWNQGFDHAQALQKISCPTLLMHANFSIMPDGTLYGAMNQQQADRAASLLAHGQLVKVDASHVVNLDKPEEFVGILEKFFLKH